MKFIQTLIISLFATLISCKDSKTAKGGKELEKPEKTVLTKPTVSFTFDDGSTADLVGFQFKKWNRMILSHLEKENLKAIFFVTGKNKISKKGQFLLKSWNDKGHKIANHSFSHPNFSLEKILLVSLRMS